MLTTQLKNITKYLTKKKRRKHLTDKLNVLCILLLTFDSEILLRANFKIKGKYVRSISLVVVVVVIVA